MKKSATAITLCILVLTLVLTVTFSVPTAVADEIKIYPDETSSYAAYGNAVAYTAGNKLYVSSEQGQSAGVSYKGVCLSIAMNGQYVFMLTSEANEASSYVSFLAYAYSTDPLAVQPAQNALKLFGVSDEDIANNKFLVNETVIGGVTMGGYDLLYIDDDYVYCMSRSDSVNPDGTLPNDCIYFGDLTTMQWNRNGITVKDFATATDFVVCRDKNTLYFNSQGKLYCTDDASMQPDSILCCDKTVLSLAYADGLLYILSDDGIYAVDTTDYSYKQVLAETFDGKIRTLNGDGVTYLLVQDKAGKSVSQYICSGSDISDAKLEYYSIFDGVVYNDPSTYDLIKVGKCTTDTDAYFSPKNRKTEFSLKAGEYVLALAKQDGYYYVRNTDGKTAYVQENELTLLEASSETAVGKYAQALHDNTNVYLYPYISDDIVATVNVDDLLIVVDNVATDGDKQVWGWYKVCLVSEDGTMTYGYVQSDYASKYTNFKLPSFSTDATVSAGSLGGIINVYLLPDESSEVLGTLTDGDKITLAQEKLDTSSEWTKIVYKDMVGYVKTANLITESITPLQITLIVVFSVVIVATAIVVVLVVKKRNAQKFDY